MDDPIHEMAKRCFGYGRWEAPHWFIGPEQAQARHENDDVTARLNAWLQLGSRELCDCREFHALLGGHPWHREKPPLQKTWRPLLLLLAIMLDKPTDNEALRRYQRDHWGMLDGETCVIELSGLAARNFMVLRDRRSFRDERIAVIRDRISQYEPVIVVMYGERDRNHWEKIVGQSFRTERILRVGPTVFVLTRHPVSHGLTSNYWRNLGLGLRGVIREHC